MRAQQAALSGGHRPVGSDGVLTFCRAQQSALPGVLIGGDQLRIWIGKTIATICSTLPVSSCERPVDWPVSGRSPHTTLFVLI